MSRMLINELDKANKEILNLKSQIVKLKLLLDEKYESQEPTPFFSDDLLTGKVYYKAREIKCVSSDGQLRASLSPNSFGEIEIIFNARNGRDSEYYSEIAAISPQSGNYIKIVKRGRS